MKSRADIIREAISRDCHRDSLYEADFRLVTFDGSGFPWEGGKREIDIDEQAKSAITYDKIEPEILSLVMAREGGYSEADLKKLWDCSELEKHNPGKFEVSTLGKRAWIWLSLLYRWIGWGDQEGLTPIGEKDRLATTKDDEIELPAFRNLIEKLKLRCQVNIPLPVCLFPEKRKKKKGLISSCKAAKPSISAGSSKGKMTVKAAAIHYSKSEATIRRWIEEGKIMAEKDIGGNNWLIPYPPEESKSLESEN